MVTETTTDLHINPISALSSCVRPILYYTPSWSRLFSAIITHPVGFVRFHFSSRATFPITPTSASVLNLNYSLPHNIENNNMSRARLIFINTIIIHHYYSRCCCGRRVPANNAPRLRRLCFTRPEEESFKSVPMMRNPLGIRRLSFFSSSNINHLSEFHSLQFHRHR